MSESSLVTALIWCAVGVGGYLVITLGLWPALSKFATGHHEKHSLYSEIHGLLEISVKQTAAIIEIRDTLRDPAVKKQPPEVLAIWERLGVFGQAIETHLAKIDSEKQIALLGQIRDMAERYLASVEFTGKNSVERWGKFQEALQKQAIQQLEALRGIQAAMEQAVSIWKDPQQDLTLAALLKQGEIQLEALAKINTQLEKNDQRLFEFVASTKRIMRAIEGGDGADLGDDELIEKAKLIRAQAEDRGVSLTLEDCIKRARELDTYQRR